MELQGEGGELRVRGNGDGGAALEETVLDGVGEVGVELLGQQGRPGGNGGGAGGVQGWSVGEEGLEDVRRGVVGGLVRLGVESGGLELAKVMEDCLGGRFIADGGPNLVLFDDGREAGEVTVTEEGFQAVGQGPLGRGGGGAGPVWGRRDDRVRGPKGREEGSRGLKEVKGAIVIAVASGAGSRNTGPHTGGDRGCRGGGLGNRGAGGCGVGAVGCSKGSGQIAGAGSRGNGGDRWRALGKAEGEGGSDGAKGFQAGVEGGEGWSGGFNGDIAKALALVLGGLLAVGGAEGG
eukprot:scaffold14268_cov156-Amphora_coffeaeformis.AAC.3